MMVKKQSAIAKDSRVAVANNERDARLSEIDAVKEANIRQQEADLLVGQKKADKDRGIAIATEQAQQEIATQKKITAEKTMQVLMVEQSKQADIDKEVAVIQANKNKDMVAIAAEAELIRQEKGAQGELIKQLKHAEGTLKQQQNEAEGKLAFGKAIAESEKLLQMAPITAQIALAKEIGENASYQQYLLSLEGLKTVLAVGVAKAEALKAADIKVIANTGTAEKGIDSVSDMFSAQGGLAVGSMLEALGNTEIGKAVLDKITTKK
jgi:flotillin